MQKYHVNARTNQRMREKLQKTTNLKQTAIDFEIDIRTAKKWKNRPFTEDLPSFNKTIRKKVTQEQEILIVLLRKLLKPNKYEITEIINEKIKSNKLSSSTVYNVLKKNSLSKMLPEQKEIKKYEKYKPGFIHVDVTYFPTISGQKMYLFTSIDRATRLIYYKLYDNKTKESAKDFLKTIIDFYPFTIHKILTDNGLEFTNKLLKTKRLESVKKQSEFTKECLKNNIEHRTTKAFRPQTNGLVERLNSKIKRATIYNFNYKDYNEVIIDLNNYLKNYTFYIIHCGLLKDENVKTPIEALFNYYKTNPELFKTSLDNFKNVLHFCTI